MPDTTKGQLKSIADVLKESVERPTTLSQNQLERFAESHEALVKSATTDESKALLAGVEAALLNRRFRETGRFWSSKPGKDSLGYEYISEGMLRDFVAGKLEEDHGGPI